MNIHLSCVLCAIYFLFLKLFKLPKYSIATTKCLFSMATVAEHSLPNFIYTKPRNFNRTHIRMKEKDIVI